MERKSKVEGDSYLLSSTSFGNSDTNTKDRIRTEFTLVGSPI